MSAIRIYPREALNALLGKPASCIWETSITGYDVTEWRKDNHGDEQPERSRFVPTLAEAQAVGKLWGKAVTP